MRQRELKKEKALVEKLTYHQRRALLDELVGTEAAGICIGVIEGEGERRPCPHCGSHQVIRNGSAHGLQRYKCRACQRTYTR